MPALSAAMAAPPIEDWNGSKPGARPPACRAFPRDEPMVFFASTADFSSRSASAFLALAAP